MTNLQEVEKHYYCEVGTFIDLVCQRKMSCAKIILVATKADGEQSQPSCDVLSAILQRTKDHISYLFGPASDPVCFLFDEVLITTSSKSVSRNQLCYLQRVLGTMVKDPMVKPLSKRDIPQCWIKWLQELRKFPSYLLPYLSQI